MSADEMFEKLGYKMNNKEEGKITYYYLGEKEKFKNGREKKSYVYGTDKEIVFYLIYQKIMAYSPTLIDDYENPVVLITQKELQAINKKCEELGWIRNQLEEMEFKDRVIEDMASEIAFLNYETIGGWCKKEKCEKYRKKDRFGREICDTNDTECIKKYFYEE